MTASYNVLIDAQFSENMTVERVAEAFPNAIHVESTGVNLNQIGLGVQATSLAHAYRLGVNLLEATLEADGIREYDVFHANVYGPGEREEEHVVIDE
jgi:hypothetical protein